MAFHKKEAFSKREQELADLAKALSHPARIAILKVLAQRNECMCGDIVEELPLARIKECWADSRHH
jgi:ArsR family transcriptional regulator, arsenate/arsenite/antimonite-responsive transcriptional repressor